jgi:hypothetical protein
MSLGLKPLVDTTLNRKDTAMLFQEHKSARQPRNGTDERPRGWLQQKGVTWLD